MIIGTLILAEMVARLDDSLGRIVSSLGDRGMLKNSVIVFMSDNGGATIGKFRNWASNWPLRGVRLYFFSFKPRVYSHDYR